MSSDRGSDGEPQPRTRVRSRPSGRIDPEHRKKVPRLAEAEVHRQEANLAAERLKVEEQRAALAARETLFEEHQRELQEKMKSFAKA